MGNATEAKCRSAFEFKVNDLVAKIGPVNKRESRLLNLLVETATIDSVLFVKNVRYGHLVYYGYDCYVHDAVWLFSSIMDASSYWLWCDRNEPNAAACHKLYSNSYSRAARKIINDATRAMTDLNNRNPIIDAIVELTGKVIHAMTELQFIRTDLKGTEWMTYLCGGRESDADGFLNLMHTDSEFYEHYEVKSEERWKNVLDFLHTNLPPRHYRIVKDYFESHSVGGEWIPRYSYILSQKLEARCSLYLSPETELRKDWDESTRGPLYSRTEYENVCKAMFDMMMMYSDELYKLINE